MHGILKDQDLIQQSIFNNFELRSSIASCKLNVKQKVPVSGRLSSLPLNKIVLCSDKEYFF